MSLPPIRVVIDASNTIDRAGLAALLASFPGFDILPVGGFIPPDVYVYDAGHSLASLHSLAQPAPILVLTTQTEVKAFPPGISGLFSKNESPEILASAIRQVARGQQYLSLDLALSILHHTQPNDLPCSGQSIQLSAREEQILDLLSQGLSNKAIAAQLYLSVRTVEGHLDRLYSHLDIHSRSEAVVYAIQRAQNR